MYRIPRTGTRKRTGRPRDFQRSKVYAAEQSLKEMTSVDFSSADEQVAYTKHVATSSLVRALWPAYRGDRIEVRIHRGHATSRAWVATNKIAFSKQHRSKMIVLHELAHLVCPITARHGPDFVHAYLQLVKAFMPMDVYIRLKSAMDERNVKWRLALPARPYSG
jgi:putative metallohydrolase (TIGR04338 family)